MADNFMLTMVNGYRKELAETKVELQMTQARLEDVYQENAALIEENRKLKENSSTFQMMALLEQLNNTVNRIETNGKFAKITNSKISKQLETIEKSCKVNEATLSLALDDVNEIKDIVKENHENIMKVAETNDEMIDLVKTHVEPTSEEGEIPVEVDWELEAELDSLLIDSLDYPWARKRVSGFGGKVLIDGGKLMAIEEFKEVMENRPWIAFPYKYEVPCYWCHKIISLTTLQEDGCSLHCPNCDRIIVVEKAPFRHAWVVFPCWHLQLIAENAKPESCGICGEKGEHKGNYNHHFRKPQLIEEDF